MDPVLLWDTFKRKKLDAARVNWRHEATDDCRDKGSRLALFSVNLDAGSAVFRCRTHPSVRIHPPLLKLGGAISKLKSDKAVGICDIPAELLKAGGEPMVRGLHAVLAAIWRSGTVTPSLLRGVVITEASHCSYTIDHILALRVTVERRREFRCGLLIAYIDLKKAFDTVHRESLWEILRLRGIPIRIIGLIASLYAGTESAVKRASFLLVQE
ncbi:uncharacterized protein [Penaeus vannamei]|uniref:uncharacterized protein n=1 Tax=Penaeus vannamei TaxID=6689 RepID=UPI00387F9C43